MQRVIQHGFLYDLHGVPGGKPEVKMRVQPEIHTVLQHGGKTLRTVGQGVNDKLFRTDRDLDGTVGDAVPGCTGKTRRVDKEQRALFHAPRKDVGPTDEGCHKHIGRPLIDLPRRADMLDLAGIHDSDRIADGHGLLLVVGHIYGC